MPWPVIKLSDGTQMPSIAYGHIYWLDQETIAPDVTTALEVGFDHLDTAQGEFNYGYQQDISATDCWNEEILMPFV